MPSEERPRALSNTELLAIILRTGTTHDKGLELAGKLLAKYGGLAGLMRAEFMELCAEHGLGEAKTAQLKAALEIGRRLGVAQHEEKFQIKSPTDAANLVMMEMTFLDHEQMRILVLDTKNQVVENISRYQEPSTVRCYAPLKFTARQSSAIVRASLSVIITQAATQHPHPKISP